MNRKVPLFSLFFAALIAVGTMPGIAPSASATTEPGVNAVPSNEGGEWWSTDGCTAVPDSGTDAGGRFDFYHACEHHDGCYRYHWSNRVTCDRWFVNDMFASCSALRSYTTCYARAAVYYQGVRAFGGIAWDNRDVRVAMNQYLEG
ncbi:phospholipase A2 [Saccharothrix algeriensis]|uniref:Secreted protein n=1 Tax=Saccharothrix algeriensis TaxID=173560 RepID=A0ABS2S5Z6_9PSEU|nr:phospholipase A2 [Saccharothrix algeriensis]MBM7810521.1 hypothetical protein [Saccharothrix algeriensis]